VDSRIKIRAGAHIAAIRRGCKEMVGIEGASGVAKTVHEVIKFADVAGNVAMATPGASELAKLDKYIVLADKGISLIGSIQGLVSTAGITAKGIQRDAEQRRVDGATNITPTAPPTAPRPGEGPSGPEALSLPPPVPAPAPGLPAPLEIADLLDNLDKIAPGITAAQIAAQIRARPEEVSRLMEAYRK